MTPQEHFDIWAPAGLPWSPWAKPLMFAHMEQVNLIRVEEVKDQWHDVVVRMPPDDGRWAAVIDLAGADSVVAAAQFARAGFRPVPLYNSAPGGPTPLVNSDGVMNRMAAMTLILAELRLPADARPAFMLDSERRGGRISPSPGRFDNRSFCFVTDLPSASFMRSQGIRYVALVQTAARPADDLAHALYLWQEAGIEINLVAPASDTKMSVHRVARPNGLRSIFWRLMTVLSLRRHMLGGFGGTIPEPSSGGGGWSSGGFG